MKFRSLILFFLGIFLFCASLPSKAQEVDQQFWLDYNLSFRIKNRWSFVGDTGPRGLISNYDWNTLMIRPGVRYNISRYINAAASVASFNTFNKTDYNLHEFRITADLNLSYPGLKVIRLFFRARMEKRFFFFEDQPNEDNWRGRLLFGIETKEFKGFNDKRSFYFQGIIELFKTFGEESQYEVFVNQTRTYAVFGHKISEKFHYEIHYIWQASRVSAEEDLDVSQHIIRIRLFHRLGRYVGERIQ